MKYIFTFFLLFFLTSLSAQTIIKDSIVGNWKVIKVEKAPKTSGFKSVVEGYKKASFTLKKDSTVQLTTKSPNTIFSYILKSVNKSKWIHNDSIIFIGDEKNKYTTMKIKVFQKNDSTFFNLSEDVRLPMILYVEKNKS